MPGSANSLHHASPVATLGAVRLRVTEAVLGQSGLNHPALAAEIRRRFSSTDIAAGSVVQEPVIEAAFPYEADGKTLGDLSGTELHPKVVDALTREAPDRHYVFRRDLRPYRHQIEAWRQLSDPTPQSVLVTSGTGSGKTECFLVPLLNDLAREVDTTGRLSGVRAVALYPLNALIASQEERLQEWTAPFQGRIRFGLYNGNMPEDTNNKAPPEQVIERRTLRADPPPILVTNATMLEYMTVRRQDRPLIEASCGKLRWIILDEAHSYIGSRAAEIALLIRRVLLAFGVSSKDVRFVATSATIGEGNSVVEKLRRFLRDVSGLTEDRVHVVVGRRLKPPLPAPVPERRLKPADLGNRVALARNPVVQELVTQLDNGPMRWSDFVGRAARAGVNAEDLARAVAGHANGGEPLIPLRIHGFLRAVPGLWACLNPACAAKPDGDWPFGAVLPERVEACPDCSGTVLEVVTCADCGEPFLEAIERDGRLRQSPPAPEPDEFAAGSEAESAGDSEDEAEAAETERPAARPDIKRLIAARPLKGDGAHNEGASGAGSISGAHRQPPSTFLHAEPVGGAVRDGAGERTCKLLAHDHQHPETCPACGARAREASGPGSLLRPFRYGAPFLIGNAAPVLLDGVEPRPSDPTAEAPLPAHGRQLLSFTDSRQSTARFAAALQSAAERNHVRAAIYHAVQDTLRLDPGVEERATALDSQIAALEPVASADPRLRDMLADLKTRRVGLSARKTDGLPWTTLREQLAGRPEIEHWMRRVWDPRDKRFKQSTMAFAEFLLLRELARRPRRANAVETLGLARLRFGIIDDLGEARLPRAFRERGRTIADWRDFLKLLLVVRVRNPFAIRMDREDVHWLIRQGSPRVLLSPDSDKQYAWQLAWPKAQPRGRPTIAVRLLERVLGLDSGVAKDRAEINDILREAWDRLLPLFAQPGAGDQYALDLSKAHIAPATTAFLCPVSRRLIETTFAGLSPYGLDGSSRLAGQICEVFELPVHPNPFLLPDRGGVNVVEEWLQTDPAVAKLRVRGLWADLHDRIALFSPYTRAAEHSAQQPPKRLRRFEKEFKDGQINILNCSTTMEMGVDIGSVSSVMMTNVPPSIANFRQRVGRAGRRGQGFAMSLTYARDTPLDRETFRDPAAYLRRKIEAPKVSLDSRRIVQRHVNALLLSTWFNQAGGEALKAKAGDFFGCPADIRSPRTNPSPAGQFCEWVMQPSTQNDMARAIGTLVRGSALEQTSGQKIHNDARTAMAEAETAFVREWEAIRSQAAGLDRETARKSLGFQLRRICDEYLLGELADRGVIPGHGFPNAVVPFVNKEEAESDEDEYAGAPEGNRFRRRNYPSRNLDIAIRDYAPGAEVVVDGLVYRSAGVTLNWKRPAGESAIREIQSLKWHWECRHCGAADTTRVQPDQCEDCGAPIHVHDICRFLEPAGFTVDMLDKPHAEIERVSYIEPEPERIAVRGAAWRPFMDPTRGRMRASHDGLVFYASSGGRGCRGYAVCLECGRAEAEPAANGSDRKPLQDHRPLRFTKADSDGLCPGNHRGFSIQTGLALGHDISTDVAEVQPAALSNPDAAWALASALREALTRRLGIETREIGLSVAPRTNLVGGRTHSLFLFDRDAGGAGFSPHVIEIFEELLHEARGILDCKQPGCGRGCSACVLAGDLFGQAELIDREAALAFVEAELAVIARPAEIDMATDGAVLARDVADELAAVAERGSDVIVIWPAADFEPVSLSRPRLRALFDRLTRAGHEVTICLDPKRLAALDEAQKLALRDASIRLPLRLASGPAPSYRHGSRGIAGLASGRIWASRDESAAILGDRWGLGREAPLVRFGGRPPAGTPIALDTLLPKPGTCFVDIKRELDGRSRSFGERFVGFLRPYLESTDRWRPGRLVGLDYRDRFVHSPLVAHLLIGAVSHLASTLARGRRIPFRLTTAPLRAPEDRGMPFRLYHDWRDEAVRAQVLQCLAQQNGLDLDFKVGRSLHRRRLTLHYEHAEAMIVFDQGFGFLRIASGPRQAQDMRFDFQAMPAVQAKRLASIDLLCESDDTTYLVVLRGEQA